MPKPLSYDLRSRVLDAVDGGLSCDLPPAGPSIIVRARGVGS